jgi:hypothetical protein
MKTMPNYRNVYKSDHLGVVDLEELIEQGKSLIFTISHVNQEKGAKVAGSKIDANIAYFKDGIKPLVLNATNAKVIKGFAGSTDTDNWKNIPIELYVDSSVKMKGEIVGGVRIKPIQPRIAQPKPALTTEAYQKALSVKATLEQVQSKYVMTEEQIINYTKDLSNGTT